MRRIPVGGGWHVEVDLLEGPPTGAVFRVGWEHVGPVTEANIGRPISRCEGVLIRRHEEPGLFDLAAECCGSGDWRPLAGAVRDAAGRLDPEPERLVEFLDAALGQTPAA